jgi:hypothetical protein
VTFPFTGIGPRFLAATVRRELTRILGDLAMRPDHNTPIKGRKWESLPKPTSVGIDGFFVFSRRIVLLFLRQSIKDNPMDTLGILLWDSTFPYFRKQGDETLLIPNELIAESQHLSHREISRRIHLP